MNNYLLKSYIYILLLAISLMMYGRVAGQTIINGMDSSAKSKNYIYNLVVLSYPVISDNGKVKNVIPFHFPTLNSVLRPFYIISFRKNIDSSKNKKRTDTTEIPTEKIIDQKSVSKPALTVHGNVLYDLNYHSNIDTPFAESNIYQHSVQTYLEIVVKEKYPVRLQFNSQFSNSAYFRKFSNINFQFNQSDFKNRIKEQITRRLLSMVPEDTLRAIKTLIENKTRELQTLQAHISNPSALQKLVEEREATVLRDKGIVSATIDSGKVRRLREMETRDLFVIVKNGQFADSQNTLSPDTSIFFQSKNFSDEYDSMIKHADSLKVKLIELEKSYKSAKDYWKSTSKLAASDFEQVTDPRLLREKLSTVGLSDSLLPKGYKVLLAIKSFGIGRSIVNYSDLSAKNLSVTGLQIEYNPKYYYAVASGVVDYRFRDYIVRNRNSERQYINLVRVGKGYKESNNFIATFYEGKRQLFNASATAQGVTIPNYSLMGFTIEGQLRINKTNFLTAEIAKSSIPFYNRGSSNKGLLSSTFHFRDHSNEAYSIKLNSFLPATQTRITGSYRHYGANFQSFSVFTSGSTQQSFTLRADQGFFKKQVVFQASLRSNDFSNPFVDHLYKSTTVFKSIQATFRRRKWPVISAGYFPSSQLTKLNNDQFTENLFYTFNAAVNHFFKANNNLLNTTIVYTQFYNKATDSSFVYFNTRNLLVSQSIFFRKTTFQCNISTAFNNEYKLYTIENSLRYEASPFISFGGGIKYNKQTVFNRELLGYSASAIFKIPKLGEFQFTSDRGFIPGPDKELVENNIGRFSFYKTF